MLTDAQRVRYLLAIENFAIRLEEDGPALAQLQAEGLITVEPRVHKRGRHKGQPKEPRILITNEGLGFLNRNEHRPDL